jgi:hypothetical protein
MYDLQVYIDEWQSYILSLGLPFDLNPLDSPLFKAWMSANYPSVPLGGGTITSAGNVLPPPPPPPRPPVSNNTMLLAGAAFLAFVFFTGKKR